jgi:UDP-glucose 4-epimerase
MKVLVTGGLGYIGSHVVTELAERGHRIFVVDVARYSPNAARVHELADAVWYSSVGLLYSEHPEYVDGMDAVVHLAAHISVEESTTSPMTYWENNVGQLLGMGRSARTGHLIFASTGTAFNPTSPYARTKVAGENYLLDVAGAKNSWFDGHTIFRFYNVSGVRAGLHPTGQPTHLIRIAADVAAGIRPELSVFGSDYPTRDGTAVRDYIHAEDVAASIVNAVEDGPANTSFECLGTGTGSSVLEVVAAMQKITGKRIHIRMRDRRPGDDASTVCPSQYKRIRLSKTLEDMCLSAYESARGQF